ncbi:MAG: ABC transporter permease [Rhodoluna sp.]|nr:ABC transporter permease [Rhodoluna sp.]
MSKAIRVKPEESKTDSALREIMSSSPTRIALSVLLGFVIGAIFMAVFNTDVVDSYATFGSDPMYTLQTMWTTIANGYGALFAGSIIDPAGGDFVSIILPFTETLRLGAPLILAGLGVALGFRVGLFNVGGTGQILISLLGVTWVATRMSMPFGIHLIVALVVGVVMAALWGGLVGLLKAKTGAHEVIVTIMLNYVALYLFTWFLREPNLLLEAGGGGTPKSDAPAVSAQYPLLLGPDFTLHIGILIAIAAVGFYWWLMERSTIGYRFRMVGANSSAAKAAGINIERTYIWALAVSAAFVGLAGVNQGLSSSGGLTASIHANIGFDAITVALLGGSKARGVLIAGLLFGAFKAGGPSMQLVGVSPEVLGIVQAVIVLLVAAPPLVRAIFKLPKKEEN